jgi:N-acetylglucosaminyl-diphospho-decaprenol L-rhamnosyltransferase
MIYFLIVNYYSTALIQNLIESIQISRKSGHASGHLLQILIIDNSPNDPEIHQLNQRFPQIKILAAPQNLGFGGGCNLGLNQIYTQNSHDLVWLINPDATLDPTAIDYVVECFEREPSIAILGTRIRDQSDQIWFHTGQFNPWLGSIGDRAGSPILVTQAVTTVASQYVSGCSLIFNLSQFDHCPQFDSCYFLYYEDTDLCQRYYQQGYQIAVTEAVLVTHGVSLITNANWQLKHRHSTFSKLYFLSQHAQPTGLWQGYLDFWRWWVTR